MKVSCIGTFNQLQVSSDWNKARKIRNFADDIELKIHSIDDRDKKEKLLNWLKWVRDKADWMDLLVEKEDELMDKSISLLEQIREEQ